MASYQVYQADKDDISYTQNNYSFENYTVNLIKSKYPITEDDNDE